jgi:hypothetical protein
LSTGLQIIFNVFPLILFKLPSPLTIIFLRIGLVIVISHILLPGRSIRTGDELCFILIPLFSFFLDYVNYYCGMQLWDASSGQGFTQFTEHQKRAWSVSFSEVDPTKLASGSDDCCVKVWSINQARY